VEDVISYSAARDIWNKVDKEGYGLGDKIGDITYTGTYADTMQLLERGVSADLLQGQWSAVRQYHGDNDAAMIEQFKNMYSLNYTGASQVWGMMRNSENWTEADWKKAEEDIKGFQKDPNYQSDSEKLQTAINKMTDNLVNIGKFKFDETEWAILQKQARDVDRIKERLVHGTGDPAQILQLPGLPGGEPVDLHSVMAKNMPTLANPFTRAYWAQNVDLGLTTRHFLETDQQSRAFIDAAMEETGKSLDDVINYITGGRNPNRFDANFQNYLINSETTDRRGGIIDEVEYSYTMRDLVRSLHDFGASMDRLRKVNEKLLDADRNMHINVFQE
jgi:hypothetical protein